MTPDGLAKWLEGRDPCVAITIAFRVAARYWPMPRRIGRFGDDDLASARALLIAEWAGRAPNKSVIRGMDEFTMMGAAAAVMRSKVFRVNPLQPESIRIEGLNIVRPVLGNGREAVYASALASLAMAVALAVARGSESFVILDTATITAQYAGDVPRHLQPGQDAMVPKDSVDAALLSDCECIEESGLEALWATPLWPEGRNPLQERWRYARSAMLRGSDISFLCRWYDGHLIGDPMNWGILSEVTSMQQHDWDLGPAHVAERIAEIELRHIRRATPLAERVEWVPEAERIRITPLPMGDAPAWVMILDKLRDALHDIQPDGTLRNAHAALQDTLRMLGRALDRYSDSPQRVHDDMETALSEIKRLIETGEISHDMFTQRLMRMLDECTLDIQGSEPSVLEAVRSRTALRFRRLADRERKTLAEATDVVVPLLEDKRHQDEMEEDLAVLGNPDPNAPESKAGIYRWASRLSRIYRNPELRTTIAKTGKDIVVAVTVTLILGLLGL